MKFFLCSVILPALIMLIFTSNCYAMSSNGKITIQVVGEDGNSIDGARVGIGFDDHRSKSKENSVVGVSDSNGLFTGAETTTSGYLAFNVTKDGYYETTGSYQYVGRNMLGWKPNNPKVTAVIRKIENPVPMYARDTRTSRIEIPVIGKDVGFDLIRFDWVPPYGSGINPDFIFHLERLEVISRKNYDATLTITFTNKKDGIQPYTESLRHGSQFKLPKFAPEEGFKPKLVLHESFGLDKPINYNFNFRADDLNYLFRVRSEDKEGEVDKAMYGKILKYISFSAMESETAEIYFKYYLNPDYTRNLEFNPKQNLFGNLPILERVVDP